MDTSAQSTPRSAGPGATPDEAPSPSTIRAVEPVVVAEWLGRGECILCDVREPDEHAAEHIHGTTLRPLSRLDLSGLKHASPRVVFHCKGGKRSADAAAQALAAMPGVEVCTMVGGIDAWKRAQLPTVRGARVVRMTVLRQTQLAIGLMNLTGLGIGFFVHPAGYLLSALMGVGLTFAGLTGFCGLMSLLTLMPWNRVPTSPTGGPGSCRVG